MSRSVLVEMVAVIFRRLGELKEAAVASSNPDFNAHRIRASSMGDLIHEDIKDGAEATDDQPGRLVAEGAGGLWSCLLFLLFLSPNVPCSSAFLPSRLPVRT